MTDMKAKPEDDPRRFVAVPGKPGGYKILNDTQPKEPKPKLTR
jgi:hypothetical protein